VPTAYSFLARTRHPAAAPARAVPVHAELPAAQQAE
jgi:hypothetical protein